MIKLKAVQDGITISLNAMLDRGAAMQSFLNRNIFRMYQNAQRDRWMTENESQGDLWKRLTPAYAERKKKLYATYEGGGEKMLIATGKLFKSVIGPGDGMRKIVTNKSLFIATGVEYAGFVDDARTFTKWSPGFRAKIQKAINDFVIYNIRREE